MSEHVSQQVIPADERGRTIFGRGVQVPQALGELGLVEATLHDQSSGVYVHRQNFEGHLSSYLLTENNQPRATIGVTSYEYGGTDEPNRATAFAGAGGPLFSSMPLDTGLLGPYGLAHYWHWPGVGHKQLIADMGRPHHQLPSVMDVANLHCLESVGTGYEDGPGRSRPLGNTPESYFWGVKRDAAVRAAVIERIIHDKELYTRPLLLLESSSGTMKGIETTLKLLDRGIRVDAMVFINGHYDYADTDYTQPENPWPYATVLPALALTNTFHSRQLHPPSPSEAQKLYNQVADWANSEFVRGFEAPKGPLRQRVARQLIKLLTPTWTTDTGLTDAFFAEHGLGIDPVPYAANYAGPRKVKSVVDGRYIQDTRQTNPYVMYEPGPPLDYRYPTERIAVEGLSCDDGAVDPLFAHLMPLYIRHFNRRMGRPYDEPFRVHLPAFHGWGFPDIWQKRRAHEAMEQLLARNPTIRFLHIGGLYDEIDPIGHATRFWNTMHKRTGIAVSHGGSLHQIPHRDRDGYAQARWAQAHIVSCDNAHFPVGSKTTRRDIVNVINGFIRYVASQKTGRVT
jgi:hypothetical protein